MNRFNIIETIGEHSHGIAMKGSNKETGEKFIIKLHKKKFYTWEDCMVLREIKVLRVLNHTGIQKLKELIREKELLYSVYEWADQNLFDFYQEVRDKGQMIQETEIKAIMHQILTALNYIHNLNFMHRDLSLENIFINDGQHIKIGNFHQTRELKSKTPLTDYTTTRWYRAPEQILHLNNYNLKIDMWAIGCIMAELYLLGPLFGGSSEQDQLFRIVNTLGTPKDWPEYHQQLNALKIRIPEYESKNFQKLIPNASIEGIDLLQKLLTFNPSKRYNCQQCLNHPFFTGKPLTQNLQSILSPKAQGEQSKSNQNTQKGTQGQNQVQFQIEEEDKHSGKSQNEKISEEESHISTPKAVPKNIRDMEFIRPVSRDCNRAQINEAEQIKDQKAMGRDAKIQSQKGGKEGSQKKQKNKKVDEEDDESNDSEEFQDQPDPQIQIKSQKNTSSIIQIKPMPDIIQQSFVPGIGFRRQSFTGKKSIEGIGQNISPNGESSSNFAANNLFSNNFQQKPPQTPENPQLNLEGIVQ